MLIREYLNAKPVLQGDKEVLVIPVHDHKIQLKGSADVALDVRVVRKYHDLLCPLGVKLKR
jgi:hypothetical protein